MSYILDALKKADAQRERDPARGIHAQGATTPRADPPVAGAIAPWLWGVAAVAAVSLALAAWQLMKPQPVTVAPGVRVLPQPAPAPAAAPVAAAPAVVASAVLPAAPPAAAAPIAAAPAPARVARAASAPRPAASAAAASAAAAAAAPAAAEQLLPASQLPGDVPKLAISGGVYSDNPAQRMLVVNGQVVNEGAELAPGLVLEQIRPRTAVLRHRGLRYSASY